MTNLERMQVLKGGFNVAQLAEAFDCSVGRINELKCEPVEGEVYHKADINVRALFDFAIKHEVNLDDIDFEAIAAAGKKEKKIVQEYKVGDIIKIGKITAIQKIGNTMVYMVDNNGSIELYSAKELKKVA